GAAAFTFEFVLNNRVAANQLVNGLLPDGHGPIFYTAADSIDTLGHEVANAINGAFGGQVPVASYSGLNAAISGGASTHHALGSINHTATLANPTSAGLARIAGSASAVPLTKNDIAVYFQSGFSPLQMAQAM